MNTNTTITCPNCASQFEPSAAMEQSIREKYKAEFNQKWLEQKKKQEDEQKKKEDDFRKKEDILLKQQQQLAADRQQQEEELTRQVDQRCNEREKIITKELSEKIQADNAQKLKFLEDKATQQAADLNESRKKEIDFLRRVEDMNKREQELELKAQRTLMEERQRVQEEMRKTEEERFKVRAEEFQMQNKELELQLEQQKKLIEEMKRKAEQGSMQLQGEVQELALEELLRTAYPFDMIKEVGKGVRGADCILTVRNGSMQECGCIIFESKRTQNFGADWIDKLKHDMAGCNAEIAVIVTQVLPKDMERFGERQGVYICTFAEVKSLVGVLRQAIVRIYEARKGQENKGEKMVMLYDYLTGSEFMGQWNTMRESFQAFRSTLQKERDDFEKNWKKKQKMLDVIINNSMQISGSIEGISGMESMNWSVLPEESGYLLE